MKDKYALNWIWNNSRKELKGIVLLVICNAIYSLCSVSLAVFAKIIIDAAQFGNKEKLLKYSFILLIVIGLQISFRMLSKSLEVRVCGRLEIGYKSRLFDQILRKDYMKISECHSGELMTRLTSDVTIISEAVTTILPSAVAMVTRLVTAFIILFALDKWFSIILLVGGLILFFTTRLFRGTIKRFHKDVQRTDGNIRSFMQEIIENLLVIKVFGVNNKVNQKSNDLQDENYSAKIRKNRWSIFANTGFMAVFSFGYLFGLVWGGFKLCSGAISFGSLTAILQLINQVQAPFSGLTGIIPKYYSMLASAERIIEIESIESSKTINKLNVDVHEIYDKMQYISFNDVSFSYGRNTVIKNGTFKISKKDFVVISGISGIGKSTLFKLLLGVLPPLKGEVSITTNENDCYAIDKLTRPLFAYVPQGNMIFSGTIRSNIAYLNENASEDEIMEAARISCADMFIKELPEGLDTVLNENGQGLSEGQIQRLAVARAVLSKANILLLDEATSALDEETENKLLENIKAMNNKTCIIISHKNAANKICNKELIINNQEITLKHLVSKEKIVE